MVVADAGNIKLHSTTLCWKCISHGSSQNMLLEVSNESADVAATLAWSAPLAAQEDTWEATPVLVAPS
jgi:hypothetical protein